MDERLSGTWTITELLPDGIRPQTAEITFEDHRLYFYAGCNRAMGSYTIDGHTLTAGPVALTMMYCPDHECRAAPVPCARGAPEVSIDD